MARHVPKLQHHKASGQARVWLGGRDVYLGRWGSAEAAAAYARVLAECEASARAARGPARFATVAEWIDAALAHLEREAPTRTASASALVRLRPAVRAVLALYAETPLDEFGPLALRAARQAWIAEGLARRTVNDYSAQIRRAARWGASMELADEALPRRLALVPGLAAGDGGVETPARREVERARVEAVLAHLAPEVRAMVAIQWLTGCRPGEVVRMTTGAIECRPEGWLYRPARHKTARLGS